MTTKKNFDLSAIGFAAGDIWDFLKDHEEGVTVNKLCEEVDHPTRTVHAAIGWLAREGKIEFTEQKNKNLIRAC